MVNTRVLAAGLIASMAMGMIQMGYEAIAGAGFWSPVVFIAATVLRDLQNVAIPVPFLALPVLLGLMGHMMNSVVLGVIFAALVGKRAWGSLEFAMAGAAYGLLVFAAMWFVILPIVDPVMLHVGGLVFAVAHVMWGAALGLVLGWRDLSVVAGQQAPAH